MNEYADQMSRSFEDELQKIASVKVAKSGAGWMLPAAGGAVLTYAALQAEKDRRMGRAYRVQSGR